MKRYCQERKVVGIKYFEFRTCSAVFLVGAGTVYGIGLLLPLTMDSNWTLSVLQSRYNPFIKVRTIPYYTVYACAY